MFPEQVRELRVEVDLVAEMSVYNPFDFFVEPQAGHSTCSTSASASSPCRPSSGSGARGGRDGLGGGLRHVDPEVVPERELEHATPASQTSRPGTSKILATSIPTAESTHAAAERSVPPATTTKPATWIHRG